MSIDRRSFIKLTAVSGGAAAIAACGPSSPENQLIRFIPDEDLTPGIAELKNGVCPICRAGCGTTVRVMQGDADVIRDGRDRKSTRLNSSHLATPYAVFCLKKKTPYTPAPIHRSHTYPG